MFKPKLSRILQQEPFDVDAVVKLQTNTASDTVTKLTAKSHHFTIDVLVIKTKLPMNFNSSHVCNNAMYPVKHSYLSRLNQVTERQQI